MVKIGKRFLVGFEFPAQNGLAGRALEVGGAIGEDEYGAVDLPTFNRPNVSLVNLRKDPEMGSQSAIPQGRLDLITSLSAPDPPSRCTRIMAAATGHNSPKALIGIPGKSCSPTKEPSK